MEETGGVSVVVPVYNSAATLHLLVLRLRAVLDDLGDPYEIIIVNDGSRDESWQQIEALSAEVPALRGVNLMRNFGQHNALLCDIREARYAVTITLDDDLQNPPEDIPLLLDRFDEGFDVVYGASENRNHGAFRNAMSWLTRLILQEALGASGALGTGPFRAFRTPLRDAFTRYSSPSVSIDVLLTWGTDRFGAVPVQHHRRAEG